MEWLVGYRGEGEMVFHVDLNRMKGQNKGGEDVNGWRYASEGMADNGGSSLYRESRLEKNKDGAFR